MFKKIALILIGAIIALLGFIGFGSKAYADQCTTAGSSGCTNVSGTVTIPSTLTLTLTPTTSFDLGLTPGTTTNTGIISGSGGSYAISANIQTNDGNGYDLYNILPAAFATTGGTSFPSGDMAAWTFPANNNVNSAASFQSFTGTTPDALTVGSSNKPSNASGDNYGQAWQFNTPGSQAGGTYTGTIEVAALGN